MKELLNAENLLKELLRKHIAVTKKLVQLQHIARYKQMLSELALNALWEKYDLRIIYTTVDFKTGLDVEKYYVLPTEADIHAAIVIQYVELVQDEVNRLSEIYWNRKSVSQFEEEILAQLTKLQIAELVTRLRSNY